MKRILALVVTSVILFSSCKKDDPTCDLNTASVTGSYRIGAIKYKQTSTSAEIDVLASFPACQKDDILIFGPSNVFTYQDAGMACSPSGTFSDTWTVSGNTLTYDGDTYNVGSFNCNTLVLTESNVNVNGDLLTATFVRL